MYLNHFNLKEFPFTLTPNTQYFYQLPSHQEAYNVVLVSLRCGEGFIKIVGEIGSGKTLLCRKILNSLGENFITAYIPNPDLNRTGLRKALARELGIELPAHIDQHALLDTIQTKLLELHREGKQAVLLIDEAQMLNYETLETLRLLTNLETESNKLLQIVLFGQPELDTRLSSHALRQLKQRISFSYHLSPMMRKDLDDYLNHRLATAGYKGDKSLFTRRARNILYRASKGTPRVVNILAHKAMIVAYGQGKTRVNAKAVLRAMRDTNDTKLSVWQKKQTWAGIVLFLGAISYSMQYIGLIHMR